MTAQTSFERQRPGVVPGGIVALYAPRAVRRLLVVAGEGLLGAALIAAVTVFAAALRSLEFRSQAIVTAGLFLFIPPIAVFTHRTGRAAGLWTALLATIAVWRYLVPPADSWLMLKSTFPVLLLFAMTAFGAVEVVARVRESEARRRLSDYTTAHLAAIVETSDDAIFSKRMDSVILSWNRGAERLYGYTADEAIGRPVAFIAPPERQDEIPTLMARLRAGEVISRFETVRMRKDGTRVAVSLTLSPIRDADGRIVAASTIARDMTSRLRLEGQQQLLIEVTAALSGAVTPGQVAQAIVEHAGSRLAAEAAAVWLSDRDGTLELIAATGYSNAAVERWQRVVPGQVREFDEAVRTGDVVRYGARGRSGRGAGGGTLTDAAEGRSAIVPLMLDGAVLGVLSLQTGPDGPADEAESDFLLALGRQCAQAFERARLYAHEHRTAATLQRALLPAGMPDVPGLRLHAVYVPSAHAPGIGGDWYDVFRLPDGRVAIAIGDVVGRGVEAAVVMGQVRQAVRAAALEGHAPAEVLAIASQVLKLSHEHESMTTAIFGLVDPITGVFSYATAGHPAPLLGGPAGVRLLPSGGLPLGFLDAPAAPSWSADLPPGSLLVLHTDGLIESTRDVARGQQALVDAVAAEAETRSPHAARAILSRVVNGAAPDDIAIVTLAVDQHPVDRLDITLPAQPSSLRLMRHALRQLSRSLNLTQDTVSTLMIASGEAVNNVIEHAYGAAAGAAFLRAGCDGGMLRVEVQDRGRWRPERTHEHGGRGLDLMRALVDELEIVAAPAGTTVKFAIRLPASAPEDHAGRTAPPSTPPRSPDAAVPTVRRVAAAPGEGQPAADWHNWKMRVVDDVPVVEISGDVDLDNVGRLKTMVQDASGQARRGAVVLSLTQARYFDSQGLRALLQLGRRLSTTRCMLLLVVAHDAALWPALRAMDIASVLPVFESLPDAITAARVREA